MRIYAPILLAAATLLFGNDAAAQQACAFSYPVGAGDTPAPLANNHAVNGTNLPDFGRHLGADFWSGNGCADLNQPVYAVAEGEVVELVDALGSYLDVVVIRHDVPDVGNVYSMYGHIAREAGLAEGQMVARRQQLGVIDDVRAYFSPCHLHFELLNESAFLNGPFCNGCENAGFSVSPGYDRQTGVREGVLAATQDRYLEVLNDGVDGNWWYFVNDFIDARVGATCGTPDFEATVLQIPARLHRDQPTSPAQITLRNSGTLPWTADGFRVASTSDNALFWDTDDGYCNAPDDCRLFLTGDVMPGEEVTLAFDVRADDALLQSSQTGARLTLEFTMVQEGASFFGPTERVEVELCERDGVAACDGQGPVEGDPDLGSGGYGPDAGGPSGENVDGGAVDNDGAPGGGDSILGGPDVVHGDGACCATLGARPKPDAVFWLFAATVLVIRRRRRALRRSP